MHCPPSPGKQMNKYTSLNLVLKFHHKMRTEIMDISQEHKYTEILLW